MNHDIISSLSISTMSKLEETYKRLTENKKEKRELTKMYKDDLGNNERFKEIVEEMKVLREEKKSIENEVKTEYTSEMDQIDQLKIDIDSDQEMLADIALNMYVKEETVEIIDENDVAWYPQFKVTFKRD